jgi:predicted MFS family arabinose efflux permease
LLLGPLLSSLVGVNGLFIVASGLAIVALLITLWRIPGGAPEVLPERLSFAAIAGNASLWQLNMGIFLLHLVLAAMYVGLPFVLRDQFALTEGTLWKALGLIILLSIPGTVLLVMRSERTADEARAARFSLPSIALIAVSMVALAFCTGQAFATLPMVVVLSAAFFSGFNFMEANLPARVSVVADGQHRGTALGVFASSQFLGVFAGGALAGLAMGLDGPRGAFVVSALAAVVWLVVQLATLPAKGDEHPGNAA